MGVLATAALLGSGVAIAYMVIPRDETTAPPPQSGAVAKAPKPTAPALTKAQKRARHDAVAKVKSEGYDVVRLADWRAGPKLKVLIGDTDSGAMRAFFFSGAKFVGHDDPATSSSLRVVKSGKDSVTLAYKVTTGECEAKQWGVGVAIPIGQGAIRASYSQADDIKGDMATPYLAVNDVAAAIGAPTACGGSTALGADAAGDNGAKQYNIGYDYRFSKRTTVGAGYAMIKNDPGARFTWSGLSSAQNGQEVTPPAGSDVSIFFISMIHRF